ncbi:4418_t:CDS:2, partial [Cetraspora pellucida]
ALSVTSQMPILLSINGHSDKNDITNSVNLKQAQSDIFKKIISSEQIENTSDNEKCQEISDVLQTIACLYEKACHAENKTLKANQAKILCLYNYFKEFYYQVKEIMRMDQIKNLYKKTYKAKKIHELFKKIEVDKIKYIKTYSANFISELTNNKIQTIIDYFFKNPNKELSNDQDEFIKDSSEAE